MDKKTKRSLANDTALHVIKGALVKVLGPEAAITTAVQFSTPTKASIFIAYDKEISDDQRLQIQEQANEIINRNVEVKEFTMERKTAEEKYTKNPINHTYIYDKFPVKAEITNLSIVEIADWNINCCQGPHTKTTGELEALCILKIKKKGKKGETEVLFDIGKPAVEGLKAQKQAPSTSGRVKVDKRLKPQLPPSTTTSTTTSTSKEEKYSTESKSISPSSSYTQTTTTTLITTTIPMPITSLSIAGGGAVLNGEEVKRESQVATKSSCANNQ